MEVDAIHHLLLLAFTRSNHAMHTRTREFGLTPGQPKVLEFVADHDGCLQRDIARSCEMDRATATGILSRMEELELIERVPKAGDRRALEVHLTDKGWQAADIVARCGAEVDEIACAGMTRDERDEFSRLLARVAENFGRKGTESDDRNRN